MRLPSVGVMVHAVAATWSRFFGSGNKDFASTELRPVPVRQSPASGRSKKAQERKPSPPRRIKRTIRSVDALGLRPEDG